MATFAKIECGFEVSDDEGNTTWCDKDSKEYSDTEEDLENQSQSQKEKDQ